MTQSYDELKKALEEVKDIGLDLTLKETNGIKRIVITDLGVAEIEVAIKDLKKYEAQMKLEIIKLVKIKLGFPGIKLTFSESDFFKPGTTQIKYLAIASGKGGVGKSTVTANLALAFMRQGIQVGIIDADVYGPSIPKVMQLKPTPLKTTDDEKMIPLSKDGIEVISTEFFMPPDKPLMWRGPLLGKVLSHYFGGVSWNPNTKLILIDLPPGTGDVAIDVKEYVPKSKVLVVTTPHPNASHVAVKAGFGAIQIGHEVIGVVENMSYYFNHASQKRDYIFGIGGGDEVAKKLEVEKLGEIAIGQPKEEGSYLYSKHDMQGKMFDLIASKIAKIMEL